MDTHCKKTEKKNQGCGQAFPDVQEKVVPDIALLSYMGYFLLVKSKEVCNNLYRKKGGSITLYNVNNPVLKNDEQTI